MTDEPAVRSAQPPVWAEVAIVAGVTLAFAVAAARLTTWDRPFGDGWNRYLGNAIAIREQEWSGYLRWRGPLHAWLCLGLMPITGTLVMASQLISFLSATAALPLTWLLGRRLFGRWAGLLALLLLAGWPDLRVFARLSSPYAFDAALLTSAAYLAVAGSTPGGPAGLTTLAGVLLGLGIATDLRFLPLTAMMTLGTAAAAIGANGQSRSSKPEGSGGRTRAMMVWLALPAAALGVGYGLIATLPFELYSLGEQVALQRDLAASFVRECARRGPQPPLMSDALGSCGRALLDVNLTRASVAFGLPSNGVGLATLCGLGALVGLGSVVGLVGRGRAELWRHAFVALLLLPLAPSLLVIVMQHRYIMPVAPFFALALAAAMARAKGNLPRVATLGLVGLAAVGWGRAPTTLLARFEANTSAVDSAADAAEAVRAAYQPGDRVLDCANGNLRARLYPIPVEQRAPVKRRIPDVCVAMLASVAAAPTWMLVRDGDDHPGWSEVGSAVQTPPGVGIRLRYGAP